MCLTYPGRSGLLAAPVLGRLAHLDLLVPRRVKVKALDNTAAQDAAGVFQRAFTAAEGEAEGTRIATLVKQLCSSLGGKDVVCFGAFQNGELVGSIFFTRLHFRTDRRIVMLAPVAVDTGHQQQGIGKTLITRGLEIMRDQGEAVAVTYGDPGYYGMLGFEPLSERVIKAPLTMTMPEGWLGQSLTAGPIPVITEKPSCVSAFNNPAYW